MMLIDFTDKVLLGSAFALLAGLLLGVFYFAGLWWTVRQIGARRNIALLFLVSMLLRISVVMLGFYFLLGDDWRQLLLGLLGFMSLRLFATRFIRLTGDSYIALEDAHTMSEAELTKKRKKPYAP